MNLELEELTSKIIECAITVHKKLGPGFLESVYQSALPVELVKHGLKIETQKEIKFFTPFNRRLSRFNRFLILNHGNTEYTDKKSF